MIKTKCSSTFGGYIYAGDFDYYQSIRQISNRIVSDWKFDERCRSMAANRDNMKWRMNHDQ